MNKICPACGSAKTVQVDNNRLADGLRRRVRRSCQACSHRWTLIVPIKGPELPCEACGSLSAEVLESRAMKNGRRRRRQQCNHCSHRWTVWLLPDGSVSRAAQRQSRKRASEERPQIRRRTCNDCANWRDDHCWFRFPDPLEDGLGFAADCLQFMQREELQQADGA